MEKPRLVAGLFSRFATDFLDLTWTVRDRVGFAAFGALGEIGAGPFVVVLDEDEFGFSGTSSPRRFEGEAVGIGAVVGTGGVEG